MCGIISYVGRRRARPLILAGLGRLEYRGYDSSGIGLLEGDGDHFRLRVLSFLRRRSAPAADTIAELEAELALLREENARLKFEKAKASDAASVVDVVRAAAAARTVRDEDLEDEAWHVLAETVTIRTALVQVCEEIEAGVRSLRERLAALGSDIPDLVLDVNGRGRNKREKRENRWHVV